MKTVKAETYRMKSKLINDKVKSFGFEPHVMEDLRSLKLKKEDRKFFQQHLGYYVTKSRSRNYD